MEQIQHFSHKHPLFLREDMSKYCHGCHEQIWGSGYSCKEVECWFNLHKSCAEVPRELQHPLHRKHPLILLPQSPYDSHEFKCKACEKTHYFYRALFVYHCSLCKFDLDIKCASLPLTMEAEIHDHPLTFMRKLMSFTCDACGKEDRGMPYLCAECGFGFHSNCASSPRTVKTLLHEHPLKLTYSLQNEQSDHRFCQICEKNEHLDNWVYHCSICDIVAHLNCATDDDFRDKTEYEDPKLDESVESIAYDVKKTNLKGDAVEIKHFSHQHDLILIDDNLHNHTKCDGCTRHIFPPFYSCAQCSFFLHESCAKLPKKKRFQAHKHLLTLLPKAPHISHTFRCNICESMCNGFTYNCDKCEKDIDVQCSLIFDAISNGLTHDGHEHPLFFTTSQHLNCSACGLKENNKFRCAKCEFALGFECAILPRTIWYRQHQHPFNLQFAAEDNSGEYYCDICEEKRNPNYWFYYCAECSYPTHSKCILEKNYPNIKFEKTYTFDFHLHPLTLVNEIKGKAPCDKCGRACGDLDFECMQCNFKVHKETCLEEMMTNG